MIKFEDAKWALIRELKECENRKTLEAVIIHYSQVIKRREVRERRSARK